MAEDTAQIQEAANLSVQTPNYPYRAASLVNLGWRGEYSHVLPPLTDPRRQAFLRAISTHPQNSMWMGAVSGLLKQLISTPYEVKGKRKVAYYQNILLNANEGAGWEAFLQALIWDYLTSDEGACVQLIGRGASDTPLSREMIVGISTLDTYRCWYTGNWEYPVWYQDALTGKLHQLHHTRVIRFVDNPLSDPWYRGAGVSALSRAITYVQQSITQNAYIGESLSDMPPVGLALVHGIVPQLWADALEKYNMARQQGQQSAFAPIADIVAIGEKAPSVDFIKFATAPEGFDPQKFEQMQAIGIARALNIDPQDVMPISGGSFGTNTQSRVLDRKAAGKMLANLYAMLERAINLRILPDPLQFNFKPKDTEKTAADTAVTKMTLENAQLIISMGLSKELAVRYIAASDATMQDLLLDEDGELIYAYDDDRTEDTPQAIPAEANSEQQTVTDVSSTVAPDAPTVNSENKAFSAAGFRKRFEPVIERLNGDDISRRSAVNTLRPMLYNEGLQAFISGLADNGVTTVGRLNSADQREYDAWVKETRGYIDTMVRSFYGDDAISLTPDGVRNKVEMWVNKSLRDAYYRGLTRGARDPNMVWERRATSDSCSDCRNYDGQVHRLSTWKATAMPGQSSLECHGYQCRCRLIKTRRKASPNAPVKPANHGAKHRHVHHVKAVNHAVSR